MSLHVTTEITLKHLYFAIDMRTNSKCCLCIVIAVIVLKAAIALQQTH